MFSSAQAVLYSPSAHKRVGLSSLPATNNIPENTNIIRMKIKELDIHSADDELGEIYLLTFVVDDVSSNPFSINAMSFTDVKNLDILPLGVDGFEIYTTDNGLIPGYLHFRICLMESSVAGRDFTKLISKLVSQQEFAEFANMLSKASNNSAADLKIFSQVAENALQFIGQSLKSQKDVQMLQIIGSYDNAFDALGSKYGSVQLGNKNASVKIAVEVV